jgi:hypothetical protein
VTESDEDSEDPDYDPDAREQVDQEAEKALRLALRMQYERSSYLTRLMDNNVYIRSDCPPNVRVMKIFNAETNAALSIVFYYRDDTAYVLSK